MDIDAWIIAVEGIQKHGCIEYVEEKRSQDTALLSAILYCELIRKPSQIDHSGSHAIVKGFDDVDKLVRTAKFSQKFPQAVAADSVECFGEIDEYQVKVFLLFTAFFLQLSGRKYHVDSATTWT